MQAAAAILEAGIDLEDVGEFLERHRQLESLGFDEAAVVAVAEALTRAGASSDRRNAVLETIVEIAGQEVDRASLEDERRRLEAAVNRLTAAKQRWETGIQEHRDHVTRLRGAVARLNETRVRLLAECDTAAGGPAVAEALRAFLMGGTADTGSLWASLETLLGSRKRGGRIDDALGQMLTEERQREDRRVLPEAPVGHREAMTQDLRLPARVGNMQTDSRATRTAK